MSQTTQHASRTHGASERWLLEPMVELAALLKEQTTWTWLHSGRVARYAVAMGKQLGYDRPTMQALQCAALLHDIGKVSIPADLLNKSTTLSRDEWYTITKHSMASSLMLKAQELPRRVVAITQSHHEWHNGTGYPLGLEGNAIPLGARVLSLADAYDAMSSDRPYRPALSPEEIAGEIVKGSGTQFDPALVRDLLPFLAGKPLDTLPTRLLRLVSDDPMLYRELWFAAYPLGWELEIWPPAWATDYPPELVMPAGPAHNAPPDLTVIDGRSLRRLPEGTLEK